MSQQLKNFMAGHSQFVGVSFAIIATMIWSGNFIAGRGLAEVVPPFTLLAGRCVVALVGVLPFTWSHLVREWPVVKKHQLFYAVSSAVGMSLLNALVYIAGREVPALNMSMVAITTPLFVIIFARILYSEPIGWKRLAGIVIVTAGVLLLLCRGDLSLLTGLSFGSGDLLILLFALCFAAYSLMVRKAPKGVSKHSFLAMVIIWSVILSGIGATLELLNGATVTFSPVVVGAMVYLGLGASLIAYALWNVSISLIGPAKTSLFYYLLPLFSGLTAVILLGEPVTSVHWISGALILGGLLLATKR